MSDFGPAGKSGALEGAVDGGAPDAEQLRKVRRVLLPGPVQVHQQCLAAGGALGFAPAGLAGGAGHGANALGFASAASSTVATSHLTLPPCRASSPRDGRGSPGTPAAGPWSRDVPAQELDHEPSVSPRRRCRCGRAARESVTHPVRPANSLDA